MRVRAMRWAGVGRVVRVLRRPSGHRAAVRRRRRGGVARDKGEKASGQDRLRLWLRLRLRLWVCCGKAPGTLAAAVFFAFALALAAASAVAAAFAALAASTASPASTASCGPG